MKPNVSETGYVIELKDGLALVRIGDVKTCKGCGMAAMGLCRPGGDGKPFWTENRAGAKKGDKVRFGIDSSVQKKGFFYMFIMPLIGFVSGTVAGHLLSYFTGLSQADLISGFSFLSVSILWGVKKIRRLDKTERLYVKEVIQESPVFCPPDSYPAGASAEAEDYLQAFADIKK